MPRRRLVAMVVLLLVLATPGCARDSRRQAEPGDPQPGDPASATRPAPRPAQPARQDASVDRDPLTTTQGGRPRGPVHQVLRARDGSTLVVVRAEGAGRTHFRVYDRRWRPTTPLHTVEVALAMERGLANRFVGLATRTARSGRYSYHAWVTIGAGGRIREVRQQPEPDSRAVTPRRGDVSLGASLAYRRARDAVVPVRRPSWHRPFDLWYAEQSGTICTHPGPTRVGGEVRVSIDEGRTWRVLSTAVLPRGSGPRVQACVAAGDRVAVMTGGDQPRWLHTLDRNSGELLSSQVLMTDINGFDWHLLPDGTMLADTFRPGLVVGTDPTNQVMDYRPGPVRGDDTTYVLDDLVVSVSLRRAVRVSCDAGRTWRELELGLTP